MSLYIRNGKADRLARELVERTGETITEAVTTALEERLERTPPKPCSYAEKLSAVRAIQDEIARLPILERGSDEQLLYDADGLPR